MPFTCYNKETCVRQLDEEKKKTKKIIEIKKEHFQNRARERER